MSNNRDNRPELDYYELRKRHEEYKSRARVARTMDAPAEAKEAVEGEAPRASAPAAEVRPAPVEVSEPEAAPVDPLARFVEEDEPYADDADEGASDENPNPFDSFIRFFHGVKDNIAARREGKDADLEDLDDLTDEELAALEADEAFDEVPAAQEGAVDVKDAGEPLPRSARRHAAEAPSFDESALFEEEEERESGFKRFINLFVTRVDDDEVEAEDDEEEAAAPVSRKAKRKRAEDADDEFYNDFIRSVHGESEGGQNMDDMNKPVSESTQQMAESLETSGMSRRERRERAMRLAAEEAARRAEEEAKLAASASEPLFPEETQEAAEKPADVSVDEPTREFKPLNRREKAEVEPSALFAVDEPAEEAPVDDDDDEEDYDEEEEEKPRRGLFGKKRASRYDDDEDDDEDDEDYDEDEDDEDEEDDRPAKRRGLFGRRKRSDEDEDEDDEDDEGDDYDDDEDYDGDDEREDDDYDDEDDYDDDEDYDEYDERDYRGGRRSFGHHVIGVLKSVLGILLALVVIVLGLNFLYSAGHPTIVPKMHELMGDSTAFHLLFFSYDMDQHLSTDAMQPTVEPTVEPSALPTPEATDAVSVPSLDGSAGMDDNPVIDPNPVVGANPVEGDALPAAGSVG